MPTDHPTHWLLAIDVPQELTDDIINAIEMTCWNAASPAFSFEPALSPDAPYALRAYFDEKPDSKVLQSAINPIFERAGLKGPDVNLSSMPYQDWVKTTQEGLNPVIVGNFFVHGGHSSPPTSNILSIHIEAGQAFGTGHHASTFGCLELIGRLAKQKKPQNAFDFGTGAGTLAIACAKKWHIPVDACDMDPVAVTITRENAALNGVGPNIFAFVADSPAKAHYLSPEYDLVLANILARPLKKLARPLTARLRKGGTIILSGITSDQAADLLFAYKMQGLRLYDRVAYEGWTSLALTRI